MTTITTITDQHGDLSVHVAGCGDLKKQQRETAQDYTGSDLVQAIIAADTDWAAAFGADVYDADRQDDLPWTVRQMAPAPCFVKAIRAAGVTFEGEGHLARPVFTAVAPKNAPAENGRCTWDGCTASKIRPAAATCEAHVTDWKAARDARRAAKAAKAAGTPAPIPGEPGYNPQNHTIAAGHKAAARRKRLPKNSGGKLHFPKSGVPTPMHSEPVQRVTRATINIGTSRSYVA